MTAKLYVQPVRRGATRYVWSRRPGCEVFHVEGACRWRRRIRRRNRAQGAAAPPGRRLCLCCWACGARY